MITKIYDKLNKLGCRLIYSGICVFPFTYKKGEIGLYLGYF